MKNKKQYPVWVCQKCGEKAMKECNTERSLCYTIHMDICDVCGKKTYVTEPRDYGYPNFENNK